MSDEKNNKQRDASLPKQKRYLVEIRGVLHVNAPDGEAAHNAALAWIEAASREKPDPTDTENQTPNDKNAEAETVVRVGWLRPFPE